MKVCNKDSCPETGSNMCCFYCPEKEACDFPCDNHPDSCGYCGTIETDLAAFETQYMTVFEDIKRIVESKKAMEAREKELKDKLREAMEAHGIKSVDNQLVKITYIAPTTAVSIDSAKLKKRYPAIAEECSKSSPKAGYIKIEVKE